MYRCNTWRDLIKDSNEEKEQHQARFKPTTSRSRDVCPTALLLPLPQNNFIVALLALKTLVAYKLSLFHFWALVALIVVRGYKVVTMANPKTAALASTLHAANWNWYKPKVVVHCRKCCQVLFRKWSLRWREGASQRQRPDGRRGHVGRARRWGSMGSHCHINY